MPLTQAWRLALGLLLGGLLALSPARALCLSPACSCSVSAAPLDFPAHNPLAGTATDGSTVVQVRCTGLAGLLIPYEVALGPGGSGSTSARRMNQGVHTLPYGLFQDPARSQPWGDTIAGGMLLDSILLQLLGVTVTRSYTLYGRIPPGPTSAVPGAYSDTVTLTLTYY